MSLDLGAIRSGDRDAWEELYRVLGDRSRRRFSFLQEADRQDLVHDAWIGAIRSICRDARPVAEPAAYVATVLRYTWCHFIERQAAERRRVMSAEEPVDSDWWHPPDHKTPEQLILDRESEREQIDQLRQLVEAIKSKLPPLYGVILLMCFLQGAEAEVIQRELQISPTQFRLGKSRGLAKLRKQLS